MRFFNTEGPVVAQRHYCIPPLERFDLDEVLALIGRMRYFVLHGSLERTVREGLLQTAEYMDRCAAPAGHLVIFDRGAGKRWEDKIFRRDERIDDRHRITVWGM